MATTWLIYLQEEFSLDTMLDLAVDVMARDPKIHQTLHSILVSGDSTYQDLSVSPALF